MRYTNTQIAKAINNVIDNAETLNNALDVALRATEIEKQNKRYRKALEKIKLNVKICGNEEYFPQVVEEIVNKVLEDEE